MYVKSVLVFFFCISYLTIQAQSKIPENSTSKLKHIQTFSWKPSDKKYGIDAEFEFSLSYYVGKTLYSDDESIFVAQNVKITKGNTIYNNGKIYTREEVGEKAFNQIRVQEVDFKVTLTDGSRTVDVFFMKVSPNIEDHVRYYGWDDVFYGDYHADRKPLDNDTMEKHEALVNKNKKMIKSNSFKVLNVELLDAKCYNIPDDRATRKNKK